MAFGEVYTALQTGVLDGFEHGAAVVKAQKMYEVTKYIALTRHLFGPLVFAYSKPEWEKLSDTEKDIILEAARMARDVQRGLAPIREAEAFEFLKGKGMVINEIDTSTFRENAVAIQDEIAKERGASDLLELIRSID
jgi:TRAP-type C4-dicarboxylate transport system substrate-binding protein